MGTNGNGRLILCVDDEAKGLFVRKMFLESQGYHVFTAENGRDALVLFAAEPIDLVILDYMMPGMMGDVVATKMKQLKAAVPILLLSAYIDLPHEVLLMVDKYATKGESPAVLLEKIAELLKAARPRSKATSMK